MPTGKNCCVIARYTELSVVPRSLVKRLVHVPARKDGRAFGSLIDLGSFFICFQNCYSA